MANAIGILTNNKYMMKQNIEQEDGIVTITWWSDPDNKHEYDFGLNELKRVIISKESITEKTTKYSEKIFHLLGKNWPQKETLYRLGQMTIENFPENEIDWFETFKSVERYFYHNAIDIYESKFNNNKSLSDRIDRGQDERNKNEIESGIEDVVKEMLSIWKIK